MNLDPWLIFAVIGIIGWLLVGRLGRHDVATRRRIAAGLGLAIIGLTTLFGAGIGSLLIWHGVAVLTAVFLGGVAGLIGGIIIVVGGSERTGRKWPNESNFDEVALLAVTFAAALVAFGPTLIEYPVSEYNRRNASQHEANSYSYTKNRNYADALVEINQAIELDPQDTDFYEQRAWIYESMGDLERAIADYDQAIELDPRDAYSYGQRAEIYESMGDFKRAIADYDQAIAISPSYYDYHARSRAYEKMGDLEHALSDLDTAISLAEKMQLYTWTADLYFDRGRIFHRMGNHDRAIADLEKALALGLGPENKQEAEALLETLKR